MPDRLLHSWKIAADAVWEEALEFDLAHIDLDKIKSWIAERSQNIAFEAIFAENGQPATMFGVRVTPLSKQDQAERIARLIALSPKIKVEADFLTQFRQIFPEHELFGGEPEALNVGIVSQWYSFGEAKIWEAAAPQAPLTVEAFKAAHARFFEAIPNPAALEFWYTKPLQHWYKIYLSDPVPKGYRLTPAKYRAAVNLLQNGRFSANFG